MQIKKTNQLEKDIDTLSELVEISEDDNSLRAELNKDIENIADRMDKYDVTMFLSGKHDASNCIVNIHSGAGGTEAYDWVSMLFRMYSMWVEKNNFKLEIIDFQAGDEAGYKSITFMVKGKFAYGYLRRESGVHRLVRISPFDSNKRRHTSFASVAVMPEISDDIDIQINPDDLRVDTFRSSGAGGQHVNKTDSAIRITHIPTNTIVSCQNERSQFKNKSMAMKILKSRLYQLEEEKKKKRMDEIGGEKKKIEWGSQIRSYVLHPYKMVKDHRTNIEKKDMAAVAVLDGGIDDFIEAALKMNI